MAAALSGLVGSRTRGPAHLELRNRAGEVEYLPADPDLACWPARNLGERRPLAVGEPGPRPHLLEPPDALVEAFTLLLAFPSVRPFPNDPFQIKARIGVVFVDRTGSNRVVEGTDLARQYVRRLIESAITIGCREPNRVADQSGGSAPTLPPLAKDITKGARGRDGVTDSAHRSHDTDPRLGLARRVACTAMPVPAYVDAPLDTGGVNWDQIDDRAPPVAPLHRRDRSMTWRSIWAQRRGSPSRGPASAASPAERVNACSSQRRGNSKFRYLSLDATYPTVGSSRAHPAANSTTVTTQRIRRPCAFGRTPPYEIWPTIRLLLADSCRIPEMPSACETTTAPAP